MKRNRLIWRAALAGGALVLVQSDAVAGFSTPPDPTLTVTTTFSGLLMFRHETVSFSGGDYCGDAYHPVIDPKPGTVPRVDVTCSHTVFVGLWQAGPPGMGGVWGDSVTLQSSPGGFMVGLSGVGQMSGSFEVYCGQPNSQLFVYDLDEGTVLTGPAIPSFACERIIHY